MDAAHGHHLATMVEVVGDDAHYHPSWLEHAPVVRPGEVFVFTVEMHIVQALQPLQEVVGVQERRYPVSLFAAS